MEKNEGEKSVVSFKVTHKQNRAENLRMVDIEIDA